MTQTKPPPENLERFTCKTCPGSDLAQELWQQVREAFPDLRGSRFRVEQGGGDHLLLIVDETRAYRFPREGTHDMDLEIKVLDRLRPLVQVAVPAYDLVDPQGRFASYALIAGSPLSPSGYAALLRTSARAAIADAVALLKVLHALDPEAIARPEAWPRMWSASEFAVSIEGSGLPLLAERRPALAGPIENFLQRYRNYSAPCEVVLHGDLVGDHLLVDDDTGRLVGIIDFSDVAVGDPAHDFFGFWGYGASAAAYAVACYDAGNIDPTLLARSGNNFARYQIDRLCDMIVEGAPDESIDRSAQALAALLAFMHSQ